MANRNRPSCDICGHGLVKNGKTAAGTQRWLCPQCNVSSINTRAHASEIRHFKIFIDWVLSGESADHLAKRLGVTRRTLTRWFKLLWFITVPTATDPYRVYDQVFIDGTYFHKKCLLVACTNTHVIAWHWCLRESSYEYLKLLDKIAQPLIVTTDGSGGALKALRIKWPDVAIQRCLVHVQRNTFADISRNPIHPAHKAIRKLGYMLVQVHNREDAARFTAAVHHTRITFADWLKQRTYRSAIPAGQVPKWVSANQKWWYTHRNARRALKRLEKLIHAGQLFTFLDPPEGVTQDLKATTNLLEGGINKQLKDLAGNHRGMFDEHQRITMDWWLYTHTEDPVAPLELAKQQDFGRQGEKVARAAWAKEQRKRRGHPDGRPATFDTGIDNEWNPSLGVRKGWAGRS